jgi:hypothetical protein
MYLYSRLDHMEPAPPSYMLGAWQDRTRELGYTTDEKAIAALKQFISDNFKPSNPDVQFLVRQGLIADTSEPVLAYYGLTRLLNFSESDARDFIATAYPAPVAAKAAAAQETHDVGLVQKDLSKATVALAQEVAQANQAAAAAAAAQAKADADKTKAAQDAANAAAAAAQKAQAEAIAAQKDLEAVKKALADQVSVANQLRAQANLAPLQVSGATAQTGNLLPLLVAAGAYFFIGG